MGWKGEEVTDRNVIVLCEQYADLPVNIPMRVVKDPVLRQPSVISGKGVYYPVKLLKDLMVLFKVL